MFSFFSQDLQENLHKHIIIRIRETQKITQVFLARKKKKKKKKKRMTKQRYE